jgi:hypothetical protein
MVDTSYDNYLRLCRLAKRADRPATYEIWNDLVPEEERRNVIVALAKQAQVDPGTPRGDKPKTDGVDAW